MIVSVAARAGTFFFQHFPETYTAAAALAAGLMPKGQASGHRTGAHSKGWMEASWLGRQLLKRNAAYAHRWNQVEKIDARKNLNLPPV